MENSKKKVLRVVLLVCFAGVLSAATYGAIFIASNQIHVDVLYAVDLSHTVADSDVTLDAAVTNDGIPVGAGYTVDFYVSADGGIGWAHFDSQPTDVNGVATTTYTATTNGGYDFKAIATVP